MKHSNTRRLCASLAGAALLAGAVGSAQAASDTITIGWTSWADAEFMSHLVKQQIESHTSLKVNTQKTTIAVQYKALANGDIDGMVMAWLPDTHKSYWKQVHDKVVDLGPMYSGAVVGWAVPDYVSKAKIDSMADLKDSRVAKQLDGKIVGIDSGAGEMKESAQALKAYGLEDSYQLEDGSEKSMIDALSKAVQKMEPIVVTLWTPHWAFAKWHLRFLKDSKHEFGGPQHVDVLVRKGFTKDYPKAAKFLTNLHIPLDDLQKAMYVAHQTDEDTAVARFVKSHKALVASWWFGTGVKGSGGAADASMSGK